MKNKLGIIKVLTILIIGMMIGAFAERSHLFGYSDNTPILPNGTYQTTNVKQWKKISISSNEVKDVKGHRLVIVDNRFVNRKQGTLVLASPDKGDRSWSYSIAKIKEGWRVSPIINGKPSHDSDFIIYVN